MVLGLDIFYLILRHFEPLEIVNKREVNSVFADAGTMALQSKGVGVEWGTWEQETTRGECSVAHRYLQTLNFRLICTNHWGPYIRYNPDYYDPMRIRKVLPSLQRLTILANAYTINVDTILLHSNLVELNLSCSRLVNVDNLRGLPWLRRLSLFHTDISDTEALRHLTQLTELELPMSWSCEAWDGLASLTNLVSLDLSYCRNLRTVTFLPFLKDLRRLFITGIECDRQEIMRNVRQLKHLRMLEIDDERSSKIFKRLYKE